MTRRHLLALAECVAVWAAAVIVCRAVWAWTTYLYG